MNTNMKVVARTKDAKAVGCEVIIKWPGDVVEGVGINLQNPLRAQEAAAWVREHGVIPTPKGIARLVRNL